MKIVPTIVVNPSSIAFKYLQTTEVASYVDQEQSQMNPSPWSGLQVVNTATTLGVKASIDLKKLFSSGSFKFLKKNYLKKVFKWFDRSLPESFCEENCH